VKTRERLKISASRLLQQQPLNRWFSSRIVHLAGSPKLDEIDRHFALLTTSPAEAAQAVLGESGDYAREFGRVQGRLDRQTATIDRHYPDYYGVEDNTALLLYTLVRHAKPSLLVEVGVANGRSTQVILSALDANEAGQLVSVDIDPDAGGAARGHPRWSLRIHSPGRSSSQQLRNLLAEVGAPDLFFHDAMHTYYDQYAEYIAACEHMRPGSLFVSDDVDMSFAFTDLTRALRVEPVALTDRRKVVGVFRRP
jgi:predicted O-methyltransferase YrrM